MPYIVSAEYSEMPPQPPQWGSWKDRQWGKLEPKGKGQCCKDMECCRVSSAFSCVGQQGGNMVQALWLNVIPIPQRIKAKLAFELANSRLPKELKLDLEEQFVFICPHL